MQNEYTINGLQAILGFPFRDKRWPQKMSVACLLGLASFFVPVLPWLFLAGYYALIIRRITVAQGDPYLPEWQDWGKLLEEGARLVGVSLIYALPIILISMVTFGLFFMPIFAIIGTGGRAADANADLFFLSFLGQFAGMGMLGVLMIVGIFTGIMTQPAICHAVARSQFAAGFRFNQWWPIFRANLGGFVLTFILAISLSYAGMFVYQILYMTIVLCMLIPLVMAVSIAYFGLISTVLFAEAYRQGQEKLAASLASNLPAQPGTS